MNGAASMETIRSRQRIGRLVLHWLPLVLWMALIYYLSGQSKLPEPGQKMGLPDEVVHKCAHIVAFGILVLLAWWALVPRLSLLPPVLGSSSLWSASIFSALYGASDEFHQSFVPGRDANIRDWLVDIVGIVLMVALVRWWQKRRVSG